MSVQEGFGIQDVSLSSLEAPQCLDTPLLKQRAREWCLTLWGCQTVPGKGLWMAREADPSPFLLLPAGKINTAAKTPVRVTPFAPAHPDSHTLPLPVPLILPASGLTFLSQHFASWLPAAPAPHGAAVGAGSPSWEQRGWKHHGAEAEKLPRPINKGILFAFSLSSLYKYLLPW